jgi:hypothetical protein
LKVDYITYYAISCDKTTSADIPAMQTAALVLLLKKIEENFCVFFKGEREKNTEIMDVKITSHSPTNWGKKSSARAFLHSP